MEANNHIFSRLPVQSGLVLGVLPLPLHLFLPNELSFQLAAISLVLIAGVYIGYAFKDGRPEIIATELLTALAFSTAAWLGINGFPSIIIVALVLHGFWDLLHHNIIKTRIPRWYIPFCAVVDWIMAASLFALWYVMF